MGARNLGTWKPGDDLVSCPNGPLLDGAPIPTAWVAVSRAGLRCREVRLGRRWAAPCPVAHRHEQHRQSRR